MNLYKYQGAGNDFLIADNRDGSLSCNGGVITSSDGSSFNVKDICDRRYGIGADGFMMLASDPQADFRMEYFNSDGSGGMMCGNGGRCIVAFAADLGMDSFDFYAADGFHTAELISACGCSKVVRLRMKDVCECCHYDSLADVDIPSDGYFLDTGTRHFVRFVKDVASEDVVASGRAIRYGAREFLPLGVNVNFVESCDGFIRVRTYEKGVEDETFACGTGIVASSIASYLRGVAPSSSVMESTGTRVRYEVRALRDSLAVDFIPASSDAVACDVWLTGPATRVAEIIVK
ncbi:MAG: diaminopimelate epimerase [Candidatus Cryptobacteroides sp.]